MNIRLRFETLNQRDLPTDSGQPQMESLIGGRPEFTGGSWVGWPEAGGGLLPAVVPR